jgi:hypothetical protein
MKFNTVTFIFNIFFNYNANNFIIYCLKKNCTFYRTNLKNNSIDKDYLKTSLYISRSH